MTSSAPKPSRPTLARDDRGAIMIMGIYMAVLLLGLFYYLVGIGEAIVYREITQDITDASAYGAAVIHARGMNLIVLLNMIIVAAYAFLLMFRVLGDLTALAAKIALGICAACSVGGGSCPECGWVAPLYNAEFQIWQQELKMTPKIAMITTTANAMQVAMATSIPGAAMAKVTLDSTTTHNPPMDFGLMIPSGNARTIGGLTLPIQPEVLKPGLRCEKAMDEGIHWVMKAIPIAAGLVKNVLRSGVKAWTKKFAARYCYDDLLSVMEPAGFPLPPEMGSETFQVRVFMRNDGSAKKNSNAHVDIATWGEGAKKSGTNKLLDPFTRYSIAQAEYYFEPKEEETAVDSKEMLWRMRWRARLRRFRVPSVIPDVPGLSGMPGLSAFLDKLVPDLVVH